MPESAAVRAGLVGFPSSGKKTVFQLLTRVARSGFRATAERGVLAVPDERLATLARLHHSRKVTPATIEVVLLPALRPDAQGAAETLAAIRDVDVVAHVARAFESRTAPAPFASVDPVRDARNLELELLLADLGVVERRLDRLKRERARGKSGGGAPGERELLERAREALDTERPLRAALAPEDRRRLGGFGLLSAKPQLLLVNTGEEAVALNDDLRSRLADYAAQPETAIAALSARIESEIQELGEEDAAAFRGEIGVDAGAPERVVRALFELMDRATFYTAGDTEARAWLIRRNTRAQEAAGTIHSDMERGFIRAEVVAWERLVEIGSWDACRKQGALRLEGRDYPVQDGDVLVVRFHVG